MINNQDIFNESEKSLIADSFAFKLAPEYGEAFNVKEYYFKVRDFFIKYFLYIARKQYKTLGKNLYNFEDIKQTNQKALDYIYEIYDKLPLNEDLRNSADKGDPLTHSDPNHEVSKLFKKIAVQVKQSFQ